MTGRLAEKKGRAYHHGDLKAALLESSLEILEAEGIDALSLRAVARRAGVSQAAPYSHFRDKLSLLAAVAAVGFDRLGEVLTRHAEGIDASDVRITALGKGYVVFATDNPALFRLMFGRELSPRFAADAGLQESASRSYALIRDAVADHLGVDQCDELLVATKAAWALVHGLSYLINEHMLGEQCDIDTDQLVERAAGMLVAGMAARG